MPTRYRNLDEREVVYTEDLRTHQPSRRQYTQGYAPQYREVEVQQVLAPGVHFTTFMWLVYTLMVLAIGSGIGFVLCFLYIAHLRAGG